MAVIGVVVGIVMYILLIYLASVEGDLTGTQLILMLAAPLVMGVLSRGTKIGLLLGFVISFVMLIVEAIIIQPEAFADPNRVMAVIIMMVLPFAGISAGLGAVGGLVGSRVLEKKSS
jgi:hypothetical protein